MATPRKSYYFFQHAIKTWSLSQALLAYGEDHLDATLFALYDLMLEDLETIEQKRTLKNAVQPIMNEIKLIQSMIKARDLHAAQATQDQPAMIGKLAENWTIHGEVTQNIVQKTETSTSAKKSFQFVPPMAPSVSINKPRLHDDDQDTLENLVQIQVNDKINPSVSSEVYQEYCKNMDQQAANICLHTVPQAHEFLQTAMEQELAGLPSWLWAQSPEGCDEEKKLFQVIQLVLTDFYANCCRPTPLLPLNERTPFIDHLVPVIKCYNAVYKMLHMQWGEKGFQSNKFIAICLPSEKQFPKKLVDGIGICVNDRAERMIVESSGEEDDDHTVEDTLKIVECSIQCLKMDMANHKYASFETFRKRRVLGLQYIGDKLSLLSTGVLNKKEWSCVLERSAIIPRTWRERKYWIKVFELLLRMNTLLQDQLSLSDAIIDEDTSSTISKEKTIKYIYNDI
ncbi:hypothetical protein DFQ30_003861 [Apophysomyces sp. BC1015]|nr:hypothetical protein DFQ30_003861 [Apophysomyces sp. BC1015]